MIVITGFNKDNIVMILSNKFLQITLNDSRFSIRRLGLFLNIILTSLMASVILSGCASLSVPQNDNTEKSTNITQAIPSVEPTAITQYTDLDVFKVGDLAEITVYNVESLTGTYIVNRGGDVDFPLIGKTKVAGLSTMDLQEILTQSYGAQYLQNPNISVKIDPKKLGKIIVDGAVNKPGVFEVFDIVNLTEAIALAGGLTVDAKKKEIYLIREVDGKRQVRTANLNEIRKLAGLDPEIYPNDIIFVEESSGRVAFREFLRTVPLFNTIAILSTR